MEGGSTDIKSNIALLSISALSSAFVSYMVYKHVVDEEDEMQRKKKRSRQMRKSKSVNNNSLKQ